MHLTELQCSMYVDGALGAREAAELENHAAGCEACANLLEQHQGDPVLIRAALEMDQPELVPPMVMPEFKQRIGLRELALANLATGLLFWLVQFSWKTLFGDLLLNGFSWLTAWAVPDVYDLSVDTILYLTLEGTAMLETYSGIVVLGVLSIAVIALAWFYRVQRSAVGLGLLLLVGGTLAPLPADAVEHRKDDTVINAGETLADTLIFTGESIVVDGRIEGDLVAFGRRVVVNGEVTGNLIAFAESISVSGKIGGTTVNAGESVDIMSAVIAGDLWGAGEQVRINREAVVSGNGILAGERVVMEGEVKRDLVVASESAEVGGRVGEDMTAYVGEVKLLGDADIAGDLAVHARSEDVLQQAPGARVGGAVDFHLRDSEGKSRNRYATISFYVSQVLRLSAALVAGYALLMVFPATRDVVLESGLAGLGTAGIGLVALVSLPVILAILAATVIGLPLAMIGLFVWILGLYFAKIMVAWLIGSMLTSDDDDFDDQPVLLPLLAGLGIVMVAVNLPFIGGFISLVLTIVGFGMMAQLLLRRYQASRV